MSSYGGEDLFHEDPRIHKLRGHTVYVLCGLSWVKISHGLCFNPGVFLFADIFLKYASAEHHFLL